MGQSQQAYIEKPYIYHLTQWIACASAFMLGILYAHTCSMLAFACLAIIVLANLLLTQSVKRCCLPILLFVVGFIDLTYQQQRYKEIVTAISGKPLCIIAHIQEIERVQHPMYRYITTATVQKTHSAKTGTIDTHWRMQCFSFAAPLYRIGDTVQFNQITLKQQADGSFLSYLMKEQIHGTFFFKTNDCQIIDHPTYSIRRTLHAIKSDLLASIQKKCSQGTFTLFSSVFLGNRNYVKKQYQAIKERFHHWGIMHFLARSGLHLILFIFLLQLFLQVIPIPLITKHLCVACATVVYALFSWQSVSFSRALAAFGWYTVCRISGLQINAAHIMISLVCLFLLHNPFLLFSLDFQLSFGLTFILSLINQLNTAKK